MATSKRVLHEAGKALGRKGASKLDKTLGGTVLEQYEKLKRDAARRKKK